MLRNRNSLRRLLSILALVTVAWCATAPAQTKSDKDAAAAIDALLQKAYKPDEPGASVIVVKEGRVILRKGYGMANLELGVKVEPDMIFRLGSITKQFTAVAILTLAEQGKLSLDDEITKFLPDYPTHGHRITVDHLLTHTSGIKSYTSLAEWLSMWRKDMSLKELIDLFKDKPMDFAPGEKWSYNNSGFVLLGAIIEKASGMSYQDFIEKKVFAPAGMTHSFYDNTSRVFPRRVPGYSKGKGGYENAAYLSMSQPHAAGSLMSSVDDLALWDAALYSEKLVRQESLKRAWTPSVLKNGKSTQYGFGWTMSTLEGHRTIEHGGGINGFVTYALRIPDQRVFVAILNNRDSGVEGAINLPFQIAAIAMGKPITEPVAIKLSTEKLDQCVGVYEAGGEEMIVTRENEKLLLQSGGPKTEILPLSEAEFFIKGQWARFNFTRNAEGAVISLVSRDRYGPEQEAKKTNKSPSAMRKEVSVDAAIFDGYVGEYEIAPGFTLTISKEGGHLMAQATGQPKVQLFAESQTKFFIKEVAAQVEFAVDESGKATSLTLHQGGRQLPAKKIK